MRKVLSLVAALILVALVVLIIQRSPDSSSQPAIESTDASTGSTTGTSLTRTDQTAATLASEQSSTVVSTDDTQAQTIDTTPDTAPAADLVAEFTISEVVFGEGGYVVVTNVGGASGSIVGLALCQRPSYFTLPDIDLAPLESVWIAAGDASSLVASSAVAIIPANGALSDFDQGDGEMGLYLSSDFGSADAIISYVEWGSGGHGRSSVAVEAGLWVADAFIEIPDDAFSVQAAAQTPLGPQDWVAGLGG